MYRMNQIALIAAFGSFALLAADAVSSGDRTFVMKASEGGMAEVKLGQLAADKGTNQKVKDFGKRMANDHGKAGTELSGLAQKKNIQTSSEVSAKDKALITKLSGLSGSAFDKAYMSAMVKDHQTDIAEFEKEASSGGDSDIKAFASKTLPTLKEHLQMAQDAANAVGSSASKM